MKRSLSVSVAAAVAAASATVAAVGASPASAAPTDASEASQYVAVAPTRALDTRTADGGGALGQNDVRQLDLTKLLPNATATAVVLNVTATAPTAAGYLTVYPADATRPQASSLNKRVGETRSNSVTVQLPADHSRVLDLYNQAGSTQLIVDVLGYYVPTGGSTDVAQNDYFVSDTPYRVVDTRTGATRLANNGRSDVTLTAPEGLSGVTAVAVNITAVDPNGPGYITAWDGTSAQPGISSVNYGTDPVTPNFAVVPAVQDDKGIHFSIENHVATTDAIVDVFGYYAPAGSGGNTFRAVTPTRLGDTRDSTGPIGPNGTQDVTFADPNGDLVAAVNANVTAVDATAPTFLTVYPTGDPRPVVSSLNPFTPAALANAVQSAVASSIDPGTEDATTYSLTAYNSQGSVNVIADLQGYFAVDFDVLNNVKVKTLPVPAHTSTQS